MVVLIPLVSYAIAYFFSFDYSLAILSMFGAAVAELTTAVYLLERSQKHAKL
jgi:hypothetical protein